MLHRILAACGVFIGCLAILLPFLSKGPPALRLDAAAVDFGEADPGELLVRDLGVENVGGDDLVITGIRSSCGCTVATLSQSVLESGQTAKLVVKFTPGSGVTSSASILLVTNDPNAESVIVPVRSCRREKILLSPDRFIISQPGDLGSQISLGVLQWKDPKMFSSGTSPFRIEQSMENIFFEVQADASRMRAEVVCRVTGRIPNGVTSSRIRIFDEGLRINKSIEVEVRKSSDVFDGPKRIVVTPSETKKSVRIKFLSAFPDGGIVSAEISPPCEAMQLRMEPIDGGSALRLDRIQVSGPVFRGNVIIRCFETSGGLVEIFSVPIVIISSRHQD